MMLILSPSGLRDHLLAAGAGQPVTTQPPLQQHTGTVGPPQAIDPAISGPMGNTHYQLHSPDGGQSPGVTPHKGRRELSNTKRAAQNRAAQVCVISDVGVCFAGSQMLSGASSTLSSRRLDMFGPSSTSSWN